MSIQELDTKKVQVSNDCVVWLPTVNSSKSRLAGFLSGLPDRAKAMEMKDQVGTYAIWHEE